MRGLSVMKESTVPCLPLPRLVHALLLSYERVVRVRVVRYMVVSVAVGA